VFFTWLSTKSSHKWPCWTTKATDSPLEIATSFLAEENERKLLIACRDASLVASHRDFSLSKAAYNPFNLMRRSSRLSTCPVSVTLNCWHRSWRRGSGADGGGFLFFDLLQNCLRWLITSHLPYSTSQHHFQQKMNSLQHNQKPNPRWVEDDPVPLKLGRVPRVTAPEGSPDKSTFNVRHEK